MGAGLSLLSSGCALYESYEGLMGSARFFGALNIGLIIRFIRITICIIFARLQCLALCCLSLNVAKVCI